MLMTGPPKRETRHRPAALVSRGRAPSKIEVSRASNSLAEMTPPEYCRSWSGDGVWAGTTRALQESRMWQVTPGDGASCRDSAAMQTKGSLASNFVAHRRLGHAL